MISFITVYPINNNLDLHAQVIVLYCTFSYESSKSKIFFFFL